MIEHPADPARQQARGRSSSPLKIFLLLTPAMSIILLLFGGGLFLGLLQALDFTFGGGLASLSPVHFFNVLRDPAFPYSLGLTFTIAAGSTLIAAIVSIPLALIIMRHSQKSKIIHFFLQIPLTVPHLVIAISVMLLFSSSGLVSRLCYSFGLITTPAEFPMLTNDQYGVGILLVYVWKEIPFITFMLLSVLKNMGSELLEVAATLNAGRMQRFFHITLPIIGPNLAAACLIVFAFTFGAFEVPYLLGRTHPVALPVWAYKSYSDVDLVARPEGIAIGLIIAATVIISVLLAQFLLMVGRKRRLGL